MARPMKRRRICSLPRVRGFVPADGGAGGSVELTVDEFETIRLIDHLGFSQEESAAQMQVARTTVQAIYNQARKKIAEAMVSGKALEIAGGAYELCPQTENCCRQSCCGESCKKTCQGDQCGCPRKAESGQPGEM